MEDEQVGAGPGGSHVEKRLQLAAGPGIELGQQHHLALQPFEGVNSGRPDRSSPLRERLPGDLEVAQTLPLLEDGPTLRLGRQDHHILGGHAFFVDEPMQGATHLVLQLLVRAVGHPLRRPASRPPAADGISLRMKATHQLVDALGVAAVLP